MNEKSKIQ